MTGSNTEAVQVPLYCQAVGAILRLAAELFPRIDQKGEDQAALLSAWRGLRETVRLLCDRRAMELSLVEAYSLRTALWFCPPGPDQDFLRAQTWTERG
jgi:hypothetical protein